jgi:hypothetical protein
MLPNFFIIGAAQSGTTSLYSVLKNHPSILLQPSKDTEPQFFYKRKEFLKGLDYYESQYFSEYSGEKIIGDASTSYLFGKHSPELIRNSLGKNLKFVCILRNPIDRAFSNYHRSKKYGFEELTFENALILESERKEKLIGTKWEETMPYAYVERGFYYQQLNNWFNFFDQDSIKITIFDDFINNPSEFLMDLCEFLDISPIHYLNVELQVTNKVTPFEAKIAKDTRIKLCEKFKYDVEKLSNLLGRDLTHWLNAT